MLGLDGELLLEVDGEPGAAEVAEGGVLEGAGAEMLEVVGRFGHPVSNSTRVRKMVSTAADRRELRIDILREMA